MHHVQRRTRLEDSVACRESRGEQRLQPGSRVVGDPKTCPFTALVSDAAWRGRPQRLRLPTANKAADHARVAGVTADQAMLTETDDVARPGDRVGRHGWQLVVFERCVGREVVQESAQELLVEAGADQVVEFREQRAQLRLVVAREIAQPVVD
jgi:hypothetical protein